jgi:hypothetical protein
LCCFAVAGVFLYKCGALGMSPVALFEQIQPETRFKIMDGLLAAATLLAVGVGFSACAGAIIGALAATFRKLRRA